MSFSGKYQLQKNENFFEHLVALGITEEKAKIVNKLKPVLEIEVKDNKLAFISHSGEYRHKSELVFDEEVDENVALDINVKSIAKKLNDNTIEVQSRGNTGENGQRRFEFFEGEMIMTIENDSKSIPVARRYYTRIKE